VVEQLNALKSTAYKLLKNPFSLAAFLALLVATDPLKDFFIRGTPLNSLLSSTFENAKNLSNNPIFRLSLIPLSMLLFVRAAHSARQRNSIELKESEERLRKLIAPHEHIIKNFVDFQRLSIAEKSLYDFRSYLFSYQNKLENFVKKPEANSSDYLYGYMSAILEPPLSLYHQVMQLIDQDCLPVSILKADPRFINDPENNVNGTPILPDSKTEVDRIYTHNISEYKRISEHMSFAVLQRAAKLKNEASLILPSTNSWMILCDTPSQTSFTPTTIINP
jgi:hypothetical protein